MIVLLRLLGVLAAITLLIHVYAIYQVYPFFINPPIYVLKYEMPFMMLWLLTTVSAIKKWMWILWLFPLAAYKTLGEQLSYLHYYYHYLGVAYLPNQLLALLSSTTLSLGLMILGFWFMKTILVSFYTQF